jgi:hypothetical protein
MYSPLLQLFVLNNSSPGRLLRAGSLLLVLALTCFALSPAARAVSPPPDGGYPNNTTAEGTGALQSLATPSNNTAIGFEALFSDTFGSDNTAIGAFALFDNTNGGGNVATGLSALRHNTLGNGNTATGSFALQNNTTGTDNTATGDVALLSNTTADFNTATGVGALLNNTTGASNTASGFQALFHNTTGNNNVAMGFNAGLNLTTGSNNIDIGANVTGATGEANTIRLGKQGTQKATLVAGIFGTAVSGTTVVVNSNGKLGVATSSVRFKQNIKPMDKASEAILALKPVTFRYKQELDPDAIPQFGLIAEEVEKVNPDLIVRDEDGKITTVRYEAVNAMLLNEFLKEHSKVAGLEATVAKQRTEFEGKMAQQQKQIEALTATVQKVSDQVTLGKPARQLVANP